MNYIVTQIAKPKEIKVSQMQSATVGSVDDAMDVYVKNAIVCLASAKVYNPDAVCILNCNFSISPERRNTAELAGIEIHEVPYGKYVIKEEHKWAITQYKFDSMAHVLDIMKDNDHLVLLDTDTICVRGLQEIFAEAKDGLLLYNVCHGYQQRDRQSIIHAYEKLYFLRNTHPVHYGGEFFAGSKVTLQKLLGYCEEVIQKAKEEEEVFIWDDEHILSIAAEHFMKGYIYSANAYIFRYWTNKFYLVSTNYRYNPVCIWHLPAEKNYGMIILYEYFVKHHHFPSIEKMASIMGFPKQTYKKWNLYRWKMRLRNKWKCLIK